MSINDDLIDAGFRVTGNHVCLTGSLANIYEKEGRMVISISATPKTKKQEKIPTHQNNRYAYFIAGVASCIMTEAVILLLVFLI